MKIEIHDNTICPQDSEGFCKCISEETKAITRNLREASKKAFDIHFKAGRIDKDGKIILVP